MKQFKYTYIVAPPKVIALSTFAGKPVRGIAKCNPNDTFDEDFGKALAAARCNEKIAQKRLKRMVEINKRNMEALAALQAETELTSEYVVAYTEAALKAHSITQIVENNVNES